MSIPRLAGSADGGLLAISYSPGLSIAIFDARSTYVFDEDDYGSIVRADSGQRAVAIGLGTSASSRVCGHWVSRLVG